MVARHPFLEDEGPGAHRLVGEAVDADLLDVVLGLHDDVGQAAQQGREDDLGLDVDGVLVDHGGGGDLVDAGGLGVGGLRVEHVLDGESDVLGGELDAVGELHALPQGEAHGERIDQLPFGGERGMKVALVVARDQLVVGLVQEAERGEGRGAGAQAVGKDRGADVQHLVGGEGRLAEREHRGDGGGSQEGTTLHRNVL